MKIVIGQGSTKVLKFVGMNEFSCHPIMKTLMKTKHEEEEEDVSKIIM